MGDRLVVTEGKSVTIRLLLRLLWANAHAVVLQHSNNLIIHLPGVNHEETADWSALGDASDKEAQQQERKEEKVRGWGLRFRSWPP